MEALCADAQITLAYLQEQELSIIRLAEPLSRSARFDPQDTRNSDVSVDASVNPTPASLAADLIHYKVVGLRLNGFPDSDCYFRSYFPSSDSPTLNK